jgi:Mce-associated membrane protein
MTSLAPSAIAINQEVAMPSPKRPSPGPDAEPTDATREVSDPGAPASTEEAEAEADQAEARAQEARARAIELRRQAEAARTDQREVSDTADAAESDGTAVDESRRETLPDVAVEEHAAGPAGSRRRWLRPRGRPGRRTVAVGAALVLICASLGASGYMIRHHRSVMQERQRTAEFARAAQQGVVTIMSMDFTNAEEDVQRVIDNSTGQFKDEFQASAAGLTKALEQSRVTTKVTVNADAVESMTDDSAVVLVAATSEATDPKGAQRKPAKFRLGVTVSRDGGQLKISKVEFVQ